jgi:outer membrane protein OmpA-like peptidoglycan-associated protein
MPMRHESRTPPPRAVLIAAVGAALLGACATAPPKSSLLADAHGEFERAQASPEVSAQAQPELEKAKQLLDAADAAVTAKNKPEVIDHYAYLARQQVLIAEQRAAAKVADQRVAASQGEQTKIQLAARERDAAVAQQQAAAAQQTAQSAQAQAEQERARARQLEADLADLQARRTERGLVVTLGNDLLFDTGRAELKPGANRALDQLAKFMQDHPERSLRIEGFTDSTGSEDFNMGLSQHRADAVRAALVSRGIPADRVQAVGYGEQYAIASNADAGGRQLNRRVEVLISDKDGRIASR